jgi:hypothetical protein
MTNSIQISASISQTCQSGAFAAVEACEAPQVVEGQGAQSMALRIVEQPGQLLGRSLDSIVIESLFSADALIASRHDSPDRISFSESNAAANADGTVQGGLR